MKKLFLSASGKINLTLDVLNKRPDGYHNVEMVMQSISLCDEIVLTETSGEITVKSNSPFVPEDMRNIAMRAAHLVKDTFGISKGIDIKIVKNIPIAAGLAGGSTDCAAVLIGLNKLWDLNLTQDQLIKMGAALGADVPFCIVGGTSIARGIGEELTVLPPVKDMWFVLVKPDVYVSTADVYRDLELDKIKHRPNLKGVIKALHERDYKSLENHMRNVMESVTIRYYPIIGDIKRQLLKQGAAVSLMTGSGPTVYGIFESYSKAQKAYENLQERFSNIYITQASTKGIIIKG